MGVRFVANAQPSGELANGGRIGLAATACYEFDDFRAEGVREKRNSSTHDQQR